MWSIIFASNCNADTQIAIFVSNYHFEITIFIHFYLLYVMISQRPLRQYEVKISKNYYSGINVHYLGPQQANLFVTELIISIPQILSKHKFLHWNTLYNISNFLNQQELKINNKMDFKMKKCRELIVCKFIRYLKQNHRN